MDLVDISSTDLLAAIDFPNRLVAQQVLIKSAARLGFALHLSSSSKQPYIRWHCYKGTKPSKNAPAEACPCFYRLIRSEDFSYHFGRCEVRHNHPLVPVTFAGARLSEDLREYVQELRQIVASRQ
jgi:hypothetical protein